MSTVVGLPAGFSDSENEDYDEHDGYYFEKTAKNIVRNSAIQKSDEEKFNDSLVDHVHNNDMPELRELLDKPRNFKFDIDSPVIGQWNLLFYACSLSLPEIVKFLVEERGSCLDTRIEGETPLMIACSSKQAKVKNVLDVVKILITHEPKLLNRTNYVGENALMIAVLNGHMSVVEYLMKVGESCDNINNCGRNILFYAIEGNHIEIARKLLNNKKIDVDIVDCYGITAKRFAMDCNAHEIVELFPPEEERYVIPSTYFSYSTFDALLPDTLNGNTVPSYFPDIISILRGMDCDRFIPLFSQANISLEKFLTITDDELETIGIALPYHRKLILDGIQDFFVSKWSNKSLYIPDTIKSQQLSPVDLMNILANVLRQTVILKCQLMYIKQHGPHRPKWRYSIENLQSFRNHIKALMRTVDKKNLTNRPLFIDKQTQLIECNATTTTMMMRSNVTQRALVIVGLPLAVVAVFMAVKMIVKK